MPQLSFRRVGLRGSRLLAGFATTLILCVMASGCTERGDSGEGTPSAATAPQTPKELFVDSCASCHGVDGSGNGPLAGELRVAPANLRLLKQANNGKFPTLDVQRSIDGRAMPRAHGLPKMPVWGRQWIRQGLSESEVSARAISITSYISSIQE